ncbi:hypothetical protein LWI29_031313 [Acer saccharum]|uniref:Polygalacturonase n=1 Tax=Acer saccharum TaxID=4024 RepID=A0AA39RES3_ACESA|nr:hypothetical protein LWI29_031313 [Acer saccharum]
MQGSGTIDGQGSAWWKALFFHSCNNFDLREFTIQNSQKLHISINNCNGGSISNIHINSPADSPNTDGIDISNSTNVHIHDSLIKCGDDCIAINGGCSNINITGIACGPGHGISVGSLGDGDKVEEVHIRNSNFTGTQNGARIKTFQGGLGYARSITFEEILLIETKNPIIIDQNYNGLHRKIKTNSIQVSDVSFVSVHGTSASEQAITLDCSGSANGCLNIVMSGVNITSSNPGKEILGDIVAPGSAQAWRNYNLVDCWISFSDVAGFIMQGSGTINGRAAYLWQAMYLHNCNNFDLSGFTILNGPKEHLSINQCNSGSISNVHINSPGSCRSTDGIEISASTQIHIQDSFIACGTSLTSTFLGLHVDLVMALGDGGAEDTVEEVHVRNCNFTGTENGVRIKTFPIKYEYVLENLFIFFSDNNLVEEFCGREWCVITSVHGTSASEVAITLDCCDSGCSNIVMNDVGITSSNPGKETRAICNNAHGTSHSTKPDVPCLDHI